MFDTLTEKLSKTLRNLRGVGKLSEENVNDALSEVRKALLSADVHFRTAREFIEEVKEACIGQEVLKSVSPGQQVIKIINDELIKLLGEGSSAIREDRPPSRSNCWSAWGRQNHDLCQIGKENGEGWKKTNASCLRPLSTCGR